MKSANDKLEVAKARAERSRGALEQRRAKHPELALLDLAAWTALATASLATWSDEVAAKLSLYPTIAEETAQLVARASTATLSVGCSNDYVAFMKGVLDYEFSGNSGRVDGMMLRMERELVHEQNLHDSMRNMGGPKDLIEQCIASYSESMGVNAARMKKCVDNLAVFVERNRTNVAAMDKVSPEDFAKMQAIRVDILRMRGLTSRFQAMMAAPASADQTTFPPLPIASEVMPKQVLLTFTCTATACERTYSLSKDMTLYHAFYRVKDQFNLEGETFVSVVDGTGKEAQAWSPVSKLETAYRDTPQSGDALQFYFTVQQATESTAWAKVKSATSCG